jgi:DNA repair protein RecO
MLVKTEALVLKKIPYGENSAIAHLFSKSHGVLSFIFSGIQGKKGKSALIRPGTFLELVFNHNAKQNLLRAREIKAIEPYMTEDMLKSNLALICTELVKNTLPDEMPDEDLFLSLKTDFSRLFRQQENDLWFLHRFIIKLCDSTGHSLAEQALLAHKQTGWSIYFQDQSIREILYSLVNQQVPTADRATRRKTAEELIGYMKEIVFPGKEIYSFRVILDVLDT